MARPNPDAGRSGDDLLLLINLSVSMGSWQGGSPPTSEYSESNAVLLAQQYAVAHGIR